MPSNTNVKTRRQFVGQLALGGALSWTVPSFLAQTFSALDSEAADKTTQTLTGRDGTILVVLQLAGGNDGLNTVVPFNNDDYRKARPRLALPAASVLRLSDDFGLHPALTGFKELHDRGQLAVVQGVGYPNPNRSHFRSTQIWQTASDADRVERHGWIGRYFERACTGCEATVGVSLSQPLPQAFAARRPTGVCLGSPQNYRFIPSDQPGPGERDISEEVFRKLNQPGTMGQDSSAGRDGAPGGAGGSDSALDYLARVALDAQVSADRIQAINEKGSNQADYPAGKLAESLRLVARLIGGGLATRVYHIAQGGYDTHANQATAHERLLKELGDAVRGFFDDLKAQGHDDRVLLMTFSEFGRRVAENGSGGTDHGAASVLFLAGGRAKPGLLGEYPSLAPPDLYRGDLKFTVDFRSVYAGILESWLNTPSASILGRSFPPFHVTV